MNKKTTIISLLLVVILVTTSFLVTSCDRKHGEMPCKRVLVIWPLREHVPLSQKWKPQLEDSLNQRGFNVDIKHEYLNVYLSERSDKQTQIYMDSIFEHLILVDSIPDLVLLYGDDVTSSVIASSKQYLSQLQFVFFGAFFPYHNDSIRSYNNITGFIDSVKIKENIRLIEYLSPQKELTIATQLDWSRVQFDALLREDLNKQMCKLDTNKYLNDIMLQTTPEEFLAAQANGKTVVLSLNLRHPLQNWQNEITSNGIRVDYFFSGSGRNNKTLQVKYDPGCYTNRMRTPADHFFTARAEHFDTNDSCVGGYFVPFGNMLHDVMDYTEEILVNGKTISQLPIRQHTGKGYYVKWPFMRGKDMELSDLPSYITPCDTQFSDYHPVLGHVIRYSSFILFWFFACWFSAISLREHRKRKNMKTMKNDMAKKAIKEAERVKVVLSNTNTATWRLEDDKISVENSVMPTRYRTSYTDHINFILYLTTPFYRTELAHLLEDNTPGEKHMQFQIHHKEEGTHWIEMRMMVKQTKHGIEKNGIFTNIDDIKQQEAQMLDAHRRSINAQEREDFIDQMNHEIRTPLNAIVGFSQLLCEDDDLSDDDIKLFSDAIENGNKEILKLIEDMLTLAHLRNANVQLNLQKIKLSVLSERFKKLFTDSAKAAGMTMMEFPYAKDFVVTVDLNMIRTIAENLVTNAIKFNKPNGTISFGWDEENGIPFIYIADTGIGIADDQIELIFKRFYKVDSFTQGSGLGLALVKEYANCMGINIKVKSELGVGTTFYLYFMKDRIETD